LTGNYGNIAKVRFKHNEEGAEQDFRFIAGKYVYLAEKGGFMSPCNLRLFVAHKS
jgi:hypothetical protein